MANITYKDQYPNTANTGQVGTSGNPYAQVNAQCILATSNFYAAGNAGCSCNNACGIMFGHNYCMGSLIGGSYISHPVSCDCVFMSYCSGGTCCYCWGTPGGGASLWYDGSGYICPNNGCPVCACGCGTWYGCSCGTFCGCGYFDCICAGGYPGCSVQVYYDYSGSSYYMCFCHGVMVYCG